MAFPDDDDETPQGKRAAHKARLEALRLFVEDIATTVKGLDLPDTYLEAERAARCLFINDRALQDVPSAADETLGADAIATAQPIRRLIRRRADQLMESAARIPQPTSFLEGERAGRYALACKRLLSQMYDEPRLNAKTPKLPEFAPDFINDEDDIPEDESDYRQKLQDEILRINAARARTFGRWGDGTPYDPQYPQARSGGEAPPAQPKQLALAPDELSALTEATAPAVARVLSQVTPKATPEHALAHPLDRPVWSALTTGLSPLTEGNDRALRLSPQFGPFAAAASHDKAGLAALNHLGPENLWLIEPPDLKLSGLKLPGVAIERRTHWRQMIIENLPRLELSQLPHIGGEIRELGPGDTPCPSGLAQICGLDGLPQRPAVFGDRLGLYCDNRLVAMAGTRLFMPGYTEISDVCTHPDYRRKRLAQTLMRLVAQRIIRRGDTPFIHVDVDDAAARALCQQMGFVDRKTLEVMVLKPPLPSGGERAGVRGLPTVEPPLPKDGPIVRSLF